MKEAEEEGGAKGDEKFSKKFKKKFYLIVSLKLALYKYVIFFLTI